MKTQISMALAYMLVGTGVQAVDVPVSSSKWQIQAKEHVLQSYKGRQAIKILNGGMTLMDANFGNGTLEFDIAVSSQRGFSGIRFRQTESKGGVTAEEFYIRHHLPSKPDSNQYTPVFHGPLNPASFGHVAST